MATIGSVIERPPAKPSEWSREAFAAEVTGLVAVSVGLGFLTFWLGLVAAGVSLVLIGLSLERS